MNKVVIYILSVICAVCILLALVFSAMQMVIFNEERFHKSYEENDLYEFIGIEKDDLHEVTHEMMQYLRGRRDDLIMYAEIRGEYQQVFEEREIAHMVDVKKLFMGGFAIRDIAAMIGAALLIILFASFRKKMIKPMCVSYLWVTGVMLMIAAVLGVIMATNFDAHCF